MDPKPTHVYVLSNKFFSFSNNLNHYLLSSTATSRQNFLVGYTPNPGPRFLVLGSSGTGAWN